MSKYARYHARRREAALSLLPAGCWHVGNPSTSTEGLEIDHVLNDGHVERRSYGHAAFITHILRGTRPTEFGPLQVLCSACHADKTRKGVYADA